MGVGRLYTLLMIVSLERAWFNCHTSRLSYSSRHRSIASGLNPFEVALKFVRGQRCVTADDRAQSTEHSCNKQTHKQMKCAKSRGKQKVFCFLEPK